ncbi:MAG: hypothetical protein WD851_12615 [Pirellulales bacterium]
MHSRPSPNLPPHRRTLRYEPLEIRAYPGALLWWGGAWAWTGVAEMVAP